MALSHATFKPTSRGISSIEFFKIFFVVLLVFSLVLSTDMAGFTAPQPVPASSDSVRFTPGTYAPGEVLVKFKEPTAGNRINNMGINPDRLLQDSINKTYGLAGYQELEGMPGVYKFTASKDSDLEKLVAAISLDPQVEYAEPNYLIHAKSAPPDDPLYSQTYTDTSGFSQSRQWYLSKIGITELWNVVTGTNTLVAVLDTGVNPLHQDLCLNGQNNYQYITYTIATSTNPFNTFCDKYRWPLGYNFTGTTPAPGALDDNGHGTAVAGIIAGTTNNDIGIAGINWNTRILPVKVLDNTGTGTVSSVSQGLTFAANANARIINVSWSQETAAPSVTLQTSILYAQNKGALVISAVGDVSRGIDPFPPSNTSASYPAAFPGVIGVGATDEKDNVLTKGYNDFVSVVAPGKDIFSTYCDFVTPQGKPDLIVSVGPTSNGTPFPGTLITTTIVPQKVVNTTTKYAYAQCVNPNPQRYPVTEQGSVVLDPCTIGDLFGCDTQEDFVGLPPNPTTVSDSGSVEIPGGTLITRTTTINNNQASVKSYYAFVDGSSYSAAIVSGLASLIVAANPTLTNAQIKSLIEASTDQLLPSQTTNGQQGHGRVNAAKIANAIILGGGVIPPPPTSAGASGVRGVVTGFGNPTDIDLNLDPVNRMVSPNLDGGFLFDNLAGGTYYLRLHVKSSGMIMGPVKIMLTGVAGEEFHITFDIFNNKIYCGDGSVCPGDLPGAGSGQTAFSPASPIGGSLYFNETGHNISNGFRDYWVANGGLAIFGYPLSEEFTEVSPTDGRTYIVQYFQRNRFEYHPEKLAPYKILLGLLGSESTHERGFVPVDPIDPTSTAIYFKETGHTLKNQFLTYWQSHGGLAIFGYPISEAFQDGQYYVQYFQRNRFELHPENFGTPYEVLLGLLGNDLARARGYLP